jgi:hypothetical protein
MSEPSSFNRARRIVDDFEFIRRRALEIEAERSLTSPQLAARESPGPTTAQQPLIAEHYGIIDGGADHIAISRRHALGHADAKTGHHLVEISALAVFRSRKIFDS